MVQGRKRVLVYARQAAASLRCARQVAEQEGCPELCSDEFLAALEWAEQFVRLCRREGCKA